MQYQLINKKTGKFEGWLIGKTPNRELIFMLGGERFYLSINQDTEANYKIVPCRKGAK